MMFSMLRRLFAHPLTRNLDVDDPRSTELRKRIIQENSLLRSVYISWYHDVLNRLPQISGSVLELGTGAGFLNEFIPGLMTTDVQCVRGLTLVCSATQLPFRESSLRAIVLINVFHHVPGAQAFFEQCKRCLKPGGRVILIEPWITQVSRLVYAHVHYEPFDQNISDWDLPASGHLSGGNDALAWVVFRRDLRQFRRRHTGLTVVEIQPLVHFRYFLSGGVSMRCLAPGWLNEPLKIMENALPSRWFAFFARVVLERAHHNGKH